MKSLFDARARLFEGQRRPSGSTDGTVGRFVACTSLRPLTGTFTGDRLKGRIKRLRKKLGRRLLPSPDSWPCRGRKAHLASVFLDMAYPRTAFGIVKSCSRRIRTAYSLKYFVKFFRGKPSISHH